MRHDTKDRLMKAGADAFADKGFDGASVRDICEAAGTNVASVRYHFSDKAGLYRKILETVHRDAFLSRPMPTASDDAQADLLAWIEWFLALATTLRGHAFGALMMREMVDPTEALDLMAEKGGRPIHAHVTGVIERLIGLPDIREPDLPPPEELAMFVMGLCAHRVKAHPMIARILGTARDRNRLMPEDLPHTARLIHAFALHGLRPRRPVSDPEAWER
ncbi:MAG: TetR/AcrR family transcriptional regulator [Alphaproteobacteria bacterium]